jgi:hypothetical protein
MLPIRDHSREAIDGDIERHIVWHCALLASSEHCTFIENDDGFRFLGVVVVPLGELPCHIEYSIDVDRRWHTRGVATTIVTPLGTRHINIRSLLSDRWEVDGTLMTQLEGCDDVDLGWSPVTNTMPIRRLDLGVGESRDITAAWIRFPELDVVRNVQTYTRLAGDRWRYQSGDYEFELLVEPATGLVLAYGDELWRAAALAL